VQAERIGLLRVREHDVGLERSSRSTNRSRPIASTTETADTSIDSCDPRRRTYSIASRIEPGRRLRGEPVGGHVQQGRAGQPLVVDRLELGRGTAVGVHRPLAVGRVDDDRRPAPVRPARWTRTSTPARRVPHEPGPAGSSPTRPTKRVGVSPRPWQRRWPRSRRESGTRPPGCRCRGASGPSVQTTMSSTRSPMTVNTASLSHSTAASSPSGKLPTRVVWPVRSGDGRGSRAHARSTSMSSRPTTGRCSRCATCSASHHAGPGGGGGDPRGRRASHQPARHGARRRDVRDARHGDGRRDDERRR
jgi:hypothetical protein